VEEPAAEDQKEIKEEEKKENHEDVIFKEVYGQLEGYKSKKDAPGLKALEGVWA
jgi:hypothetical protein